MAAWKACASTSVWLRLRFRTGVRSAQLQVALTAEDSSAVANAVAQLRDLVSGVAGAAALNLRLAALAKSPRTADVGTRFAISTQSRALIGDSEWFNLGVWTAVADIAAANGQAEFFAHTMINTDKQQVELEPLGTPRHVRLRTE